MKVIIAGSRTLGHGSPQDNLTIMRQVIQESGFHVSTVLSGGAQGIDILGECWALENNIPIQRFNPNWRSYGKAAGPIRNRAMARAGEALIAIWNGTSKGTANMIQEAKKEKIPVYEYVVKS